MPERSILLISKEGGERENPFTKEASSMLSPEGWGSRKKPKRGEGDHERPIPHQGKGKIGARILLIWGGGKGGERPF